jgi:hypothetical protein
LECTGEACEADRRRSLLGGFVQGQFAPWIGAWALAGAETNLTDAALFSGTGLGLNAGVYGAPWSSRPVGALAWLNADFGDASETAGNSADRWQLEAGGAARVGQPAGGLVAWAGANVLIVGSDVTNANAGEVEVPLAPVAPIELVGGATLYSNPLRGFASNSRVSFALDGSLGARTSFGASLGAIF